MLHKLVLYAYIIAFVSGCNKPGHFEVSDLKCEHLINPVGIDTSVPRLSWKLQSGEDNVYQTAYEIVVSTEISDINKGDGIIWESGKVLSDAMLVDFGGDHLKSNTKYYWTVRVWNQQNDVSACSEVSSFVTGMMKTGWHGDWISDSEDIDRKPAPLFRRRIIINRKVKSARAYIVAGGLYELYLNEKRLGDACLQPAYTRYDKRVLYNTYDITEEIRKGDNVVGVILGNGWYNHQAVAVWDFHKAPWRAHPKFKMDILIDFADGSQEVIATSNDWKYSTGDIVLNSIYSGEWHDHNLKKDGWLKFDYNDKDWGNAIKVEAPTDHVVSEMMPPIRISDIIEPRRVTRFNDSTYLIDFGRNISGVTELRIKGEKGTVVNLQHGERLKDNREELEMAALEYWYRSEEEMGDFQTDTYILRGDNDESFMPRFNYKGFQYVVLKSSKPLQEANFDLTAYFMHSDVEPRGRIITSDTLLTRIWKATNNSYLSNLFGYPTDCPQREKNGWTADAHSAIETGLFNFDGIKVYEKWLDDHRDAQKPDGTLPAIIPTAEWGYTWGNGIDWTSSLILIPWNVYKFYGDKRILEENFEPIKLFMSKMNAIAKDHLIHDGLGDWVPVKTQSNIEFTSSVFYYTDALIVSKIAGLLGEGKDEEAYKLLADEIKAAINNKFFDEEKGIYASGSQTELSMALFWGIVSEKDKQRVADNLAEAVYNSGEKIDVGLFGSKSLLHALSENGYADLAYKLASATEFPSWGYWIANGATTLYEHWDLSHVDEMSLNHIMFGEISAWYYNTLGGINIDERNPGFKNIKLEPHFVDGLNDIMVSHQGPYGEIVSQWEKEGKQVKYSVVIPPNSTAELSFDSNVEKVQKIDGKVVNSFNPELRSGKHEFILSLYR
ncbi:MAG: family 78 glycoside hydrolase catalytic domain [Bacteroidota bacterium]